MMKRKKRMISLFLVAALLLISIQVPEYASAKGKVKKTKYYTISKKAGTYTSAIKVKIKAKTGYRVYYKTSGKFKKSKVIKSGKSKTFKIKKTTVLSLCAVKNNKKVTNRKLNKVFRQKKAAYYAKYKYTIAKKSDTGNSTNTANPTAAASVTPLPQETAPAGETPPSGTMPPAPQGTPPSGETPPDGGIIPGGTSPSGTATIAPEGEEDAQEKLNAAENLLVVDSATPAASASSVIASDTPVVTLTDDGINVQNIENDAVAYQKEGELKSITINKAGTYVLSGGSDLEPVTNTQIMVAGNISDEVNLIWDNLVIDNSALGKNTGEDVPVFEVGKSTSDVHVTLKGSSVFKGNGAYAEKPASAIICADDAGTTLTFSAYDGDSVASLTVVDGMPFETDFGANDPSDGIYSKGTLVFESGTYDVTVNGDCIKGTGKNGKGGIWIHKGLYTLHSVSSSALKSKNGNIVISGGTVRSEYTGGDAVNAKNYDVIITGGTIEIAQCYGDGIQGENVNISGDDTVIDIMTYFQNAGTNYYNSALGNGNYNTMSDTNTSKTEVVNVDTGSHKGIKGGTKAHTYSYKTVEETSEYVAGTTYSTEASGGIFISGGTIKIDTTNTGIKYNGNSGGMGTGNRTGSSSSSSGNLSAANKDGQYIIGSPDDGIHSNNICVIAGGTLKISSSDDGITGPSGIIIMNGCDIAINQCYEGIEGGEIIIGSSEGKDASPTVKIYSNDDGINAASKSEINYVYEDESEEKYTKTQTASSNNTLKVLNGYLNVMIGDDETHTFSLDNADGTKTTGSYTSCGDGIDCNGSFYAYGGTIVVYGANSDGESPIDTDNGYCIGSGVTLLATGNGGMAETPSGKEQPVLVYGGTGGSGSMRPGEGGGRAGNQGGSQLLSANTPFAIMDGDNLLLAIKPVKNYNYVLYSSPELENGSTYTIYNGGSVNGSAVLTDSSTHDYRYTGYETTGATVLGTVTAQN